MSRKNSDRITDIAGYPKRANIGNHTMFSRPRDHLRVALPRGNNGECSSTTWAPKNRAMRRRLLSVSMALFATAWNCGWGRAATPVQWINCDDAYYRSLDLAPIGPGPLELAKVHCQRIPIVGKSAASVSPDGRSIAFLELANSYVEERKVLHVAPLDVRDHWTNTPLNMGALWQFSSGHNTDAAFRWASNASVLWTATREKVGPEGIAKSGLQPALTVEDGSLSLLPLLRHEAGP